MSMTKKPIAGAAIPALPIRTTAGATVDIVSQPGWRMLVVYRGKHCPLCKKYFKTLDGMLDRFQAAGVNVLAVSADPLEKAQADVASEGWRFPVGYDLSLAQMHSLGLYVSEPRSPQETDRPFPEPGLFVINPDDKLQIVDLSNAPFARPDLEMVLMGINLIKERNYPIRGTLA